MSRSGRIELFFGDGKHMFELAIEGLEELQEKTDHGPEMVYRMLGDGSWKTPAFIREPLRLGLIGGGMPSTKAAILVERYVGPGQLIEWKKTAQAVIAASLIGALDEADPLGEINAGEGTATPSPAARSGSASSTNSAAPWDGLQTQSVDPQSGNSGKPSGAGANSTVSRTRRARPRKTSSMPPSPTPLK